MATEISRALIRLIYQGLTAKGMEPTFVEAIDDSPNDVVIVPIQGRDDKSNWELKLSFVSIHDEESEDSGLLQCFASLPAQVTEFTESDLLRLIAMLNASLPLVGFGYRESENLPFFRHVLMVSKQDIEASEKIVIDAVYLISYLLNNLAPFVTNVASGNHTLQQALASPQLRRLFPA